MTRSRNESAVAFSLKAMRFSAPLFVTSLALAGCGAAPASRSVPASAAGSPPEATIDAIADELDELNGARVPVRRDTFRDILADALAKDAYTCRPLPGAVFFGDTPEGERTIPGEMPHYGFFFGPMSYRVARSRGRWLVRLAIAVVPPDPHVLLEVPDCTMSADLDEPSACAEDPARETTLEVCPPHPRGLARATPRTVDALLRRYSREVAAYWSRDARAEGLPIDYDFVFERAADPSPAHVDITLPLVTTCGRTPYFTSLRSGWSLPIVAHEMGHLLGLLDEYETFSGMLYPKTPFPGAEVSRMGLSMREHTQVLPTHHYLVLRRYFCQPPKETTPYRDGFW